MPASPQKITMKFDLDAKEAVAKIEAIQAIVDAIDKKLECIAKKATAIKKRLG